MILFHYTGEFFAEMAKPVHRKKLFLIYTSIRKFQVTFFFFFLRQDGLKALCVPFVPCKLSSTTAERKKECGESLLSFSFTYLIADTGFVQSFIIG